jgi:light-regulated signal transduction histidine kinase (bacteriophytochrome)
MVAPRVFAPIVDFVFAMNETGKLEQRIDRLTRSNDDLAHFAYLAAHDLQEPLRAITGFLSLLQNKHGNELSGEAIDWLNEATSAAERMSVLIQARLTLSRVESQDAVFEVISVRDCIADAISNLKMAIDAKNADITMAELPVITGNRPLLTLLFQNLLSNSLKFCRCRPRIHISASREANEWIFSVRDNGVGFDMNYVDRLFHRFQRLHAKAEFPGSGLGLALCKRIVDRHNGRIWAESDGQNGATFHFALPAEPQANFSLGGDYMRKKLGPEEIYCSTPSCTCRVAASEDYCSEECRLIDERREDGPCACAHAMCMEQVSEEQT